MKVRHLQEQDKQYRVFLYIFYAASVMMVSILIYGVVMMVGEWQENGTYVMGEILVNTHVMNRLFKKARNKMIAFFVLTVALSLDVLASSLVSSIALLIGSNVPLGFVSLTENIAMVAMGIGLLI